VYNIGDFIEEFLAEEEEGSLSKSLSEYHTWGDTDLAAITGDALKGALEDAGILVPPWLYEHLEDLFELTQSGL